MRQHAYRVVREQNNGGNRTEMQAERTLDQGKSQVQKLRLVRRLDILSP